MGSTSPIDTPRLSASRDVVLEPIVDDVDSPLFVTGAGDGSGRLFVVEQTGAIRIVVDDRLRPEVFLDVSDLISHGGEQGLLGLAFHPGFGSNGRFFIDYTDRGGDTVVAEYHAAPRTADRADPSSARKILVVEQPYANHNGGQVAFGPDGYLYVALGDGGSGGDPMGNGQNLGTLLGKILRIDVDRMSATSPEGASSPADNPFVGVQGARPEIWHYGLRNPWRFSFDRSTGALWIGDVGQSSFEEIDRAAPREAGLNFGWNIMEGPHCYDPPEACDREGLTMPVASYAHSDRSCTVIGGYVYRGHRFPRMRGTYFFGDYCSGHLWALDADSPGEFPADSFLDSGLTISSFGEDDQGELYVTDLSGGGVYRLGSHAP